MRLTNTIGTHPKHIRVDPAASWLWTCSVGYCRENLTDGFVPDSILPRLGNFRGVSRLAKQLCEVGLWTRTEGGYQVNDYLHMNLSKQEVEEKKAIDRERKSVYNDPALVRSVRERDQDCCRYCGGAVHWKDRRGEKGGVFDFIIPFAGATLDNLVVACRGCQIRKNRRTAEEAGMSLLPPGTRVDLSSRSSPGLDPDQIVGTDPGPDPDLGSDRSDAKSDRARAIARDRASTHSSLSHSSLSHSSLGDPEGGAGGNPPGGGAGMPPSPLWAQRAHRTHASCGRICVPAFVHERFVRQLGGPVETADATLRAWYRDVEREWEHRGPIGDRPEDFWAKRFAERFGVTERAAAPAAASYTPPRPRLASEVIAERGF